MPLIVSMAIRSPFLTLCTAIPYGSDALIKAHTERSKDPSAAGSRVTSGPNWLSSISVSAGLVDGPIIPYRVSLSEPQAPTSAAAIAAAIAAAARKPTAPSCLLRACAILSSSCANGKQPARLLSLALAQSNGVYGSDPPALITAWSGYDAIHDAAEVPERSHPLIRSRHGSRVPGRGGDTRTGGVDRSMARRTVFTSTFNRRAISFLRHPLHQMQVPDLGPLGHPDHLRVLLAASTRRPCLAPSIIPRESLFPSAQGGPFSRGHGIPFHVAATILEDGRRFRIGPPVQIFTA